MIKLRILLIVFLSLLSQICYAQQVNTPFSPDINYLIATGVFGIGPACTLTDGANVNWSFLSPPTPPCNPTNLIWNVGGAGHTLGVPTGGPSSGGVWFWVTLNHSTSNDQAVLSSGYSMSSSALNGAGQPTFSSTANSVDEMACVTTSATTAWCSVPQLAMTVVTPPSSHAVVAQNSCGSPDGSSGCTTTSTNMAGATLIVGCIGYFNGDGASSTFSDNLGNSYTQIYSTVSGTLTGRMFYSKPSSVSGSMMFTASSTGGSADAAPGLTVMGFNGIFTTPLDQSANAGSAGSTVTSQQSGSITPGQANELLATCLAMSTPTTSGVSIAAPFTLGPVQNSGSSLTYGSVLAYQVQTVSTAENPTWSDSVSVKMVAGVGSFD